MTDANVSVSFSASVADFVAGVGQAKDALQSFSAPFGEINSQLASLANSSAQAFSAERFQPYRDALIATQSLEQSLSADRARAAAALRAGDDAAYADATRAAQLAATEELRLIEDGLKQKLALYAEEARAYAITQSQKLALSRAGDQRGLCARTRRPEGTRGARRPVARRQATHRRHGHRGGAPARRRDDLADQIRFAGAGARLPVLRAIRSSRPSIPNCAASSPEPRTGTPPSRTCSRACSIKFIEFTETTVAHYLIGEAMKTAATTTGVAARTGAEEAGAAASMGAQGAAMVRSILSSAAEAFAGVFGFLAPMMGPFAAGPAAAAQATVAGVAGSVASADIGMWQVPADMLTLVHHNELIMPAAEAGAFRSMLGGAAEQAAQLPARCISIRRPTSMSRRSTAARVSQWMRSNSGDDAEGDRRGRASTAPISGSRAWRAPEHGHRHRRSPSPIDGGIHLRHDPLHRGAA